MVCLSVPRIRFTFNYSFLFSERAFCGRFFSLQKTGTGFLRNIAILIERIFLRCGMIKMSVDGSVKEIHVIDKEVKKDEGMCGWMD